MLQTVWCIHTDCTYTYADPRSSPLSCYLNYFEFLSYPRSSQCSKLCGVYTQTAHTHTYADSRSSPLSCYLNYFEFLSYPRSSQCSKLCGVYTQTAHTHTYADSRSSPLSCYLNYFEFLSYPRSSQCSKLCGVYTQTAHTHIYAGPRSSPLSCYLNCFEFLSYPRSSRCSKLWSVYTQAAHTNIQMLPLSVPLLRINCFGSYSYPRNSVLETVRCIRTGCTYTYTHAPRSVPLPPSASLSLSVLSDRPTGSAPLSPVYLCLPVVYYYVQFPKVRQNSIQDFLRGTSQNLLKPFTHDVLKCLPVFYHTYEDNSQNKHIYLQIIWGRFVKLGLKEIFHPNTL